MNTELNQEPSSSKKNKIFRRILFFLFFIFCFNFFLILKIPQIKIQNFLLAHIKIQAQNYGLFFQTEKMSFNFFPLPSIKMQNIELKALDDDTQKITIASLKLRPHIFPLILKHIKTSIEAELLLGTLSGVVGFSNNTLELNLSLEKLKLSQASLLSKFIMVNLEGEINGTVKAFLSFQTPKEDEGLINIKIDKAKLPAQSIMGFQLPELNFSEVLLNAEITQGKVITKNINIGRDLKKDDLLASIQGDIALNSNLLNSQANLKLKFQISDKLSSQYSFINSILSAAKGSDGAFYYKINGPLYSLEPKPGQ
jgi:type II secretion system protein N